MSSSRRGYFVPGLVALAALLGIGTALGAGDLSHRPPSSLAGPDVAEELALGIQAQAGAPSTPPVSCPRSEPVRAGATFTCTLGPWRGSGRRTVRVVEIDSRGHLRWSLAATTGTSSSR